MKFIILFLTKAENKLYFTIFYFIKIKGYMFQLFKI